MAGKGKARDAPRWDTSLGLVGEALRSFPISATLQHWAIPPVTVSAGRPSYR